jgi:hypothetical protein
LSQRSSPVMRSRSPSSRNSRIVRTMAGDTTSPGVEGSSRNGPSLDAPPTTDRAVACMDNILVASWQTRCPTSPASCLPPSTTAPSRVDPPSQISCSSSNSPMWVEKPASNPIINTRCGEIAVVPSALPAGSTVQPKARRTKP